MNNGVYIENSVLTDVFNLAPNLRREDVDEALAINLAPETALLQGYIFSKECYSVKYKKQVIGMFGLSTFNVPKNQALIWFLGSDECSNHPITFVKQGIKFTNKWLQEYDILLNVVDNRNKSHIEWLKSIGVTISTPIMINGHKFLQFYKIKGENKCVI